MPRHRRHPRGPPRPHRRRPRRGRAAEGQVGSGAARAYEKALAEARGKAFAIAEGARDAAKAAADDAAELDRGRPRREARRGRGAHRRHQEPKALAEVGAIAGDATEAVVAGADRRRRATPSEVERRRRRGARGEERQCLRCTILGARRPHPLLRPDHLHEGAGDGRLRRSTSAPTAIRNELDQARQLREEAQALLAEYQRKAARGRSRGRARSSTRPSARPTRSASRPSSAWKTTSRAAPRWPSRRSPRPRPRRCRRCGRSRPTSPSPPPQRILAARARGATAEALIKRAIDDVKAKLH